MASGAQGPVNVHSPPALDLPSAGQALGGLAAGFVLGLAAYRWPSPAWDRVIALIEPLGAVWLAALQMLVVPLMVSLLIVAVGRAATGRVGRMGGLSLLWFVGLLAVAAVVTVLVGELFLGLAPVDDGTRAAFQAAGSSVAPEVGEPGAPPSVRDWVVNLVPSNLVQAVARGDLIALIVATLLFATALRYVPEPSRERILIGAEAISEWSFALAGLLFRVLPYAVFVLVFASTARSGEEIASGLAYYIIVVSAFLVAATLMLYPITERFGGIRMRRFAVAAWPVQVLALSTRSSVACLPAMLDAARTELEVEEDVAGFVLPFAVSSFKLNMGISANFQMLFLLHLYGLHPDPMALAVAVTAVTLQSFATPGLPSGAVWTTTPAYLALGIPLEGIVLTNVVDTIPDLFKTAANVTGDLSISAIVAQRLRR